jgi:hypothetical protein
MKPKTMPLSEFKDFTELVDRMDVLEQKIDYLMVLSRQARLDRESKGEDIVLGEERMESLEGRTNSNWIRIQTLEGLQKSTADLVTSYIDEIVLLRQQMREKS